MNYVSTHKLKQFWLNYTISNKRLKSQRYETLRKIEHICFVHNLITFSQYRFFLDNKLRQTTTHQYNNVVDD